MNRFKIVVWLGLIVLAACDTRVPEGTYAEPVIEPFIMVPEPLYEGNTVRTPDSECRSANGDGIGGTGCPID